MILEVIYLKNDLYLTKRTKKDTIAIIMASFFEVLISQILNDNDLKIQHKIKE